MHDQLLAAYGPQLWWPAQTQVEMIVGAYLTQNTAWKNVERSLANLNAAGLLSLEGLRTGPLEQLQELTRPSGFPTRKAPALKAFVSMLDSEFDGSLVKLSALASAELRDRLLALPGVGPETADAIMLYALGHAVPMADEYLRRIAVRHGLLDPPPMRNRAGYDRLVNLTLQAFAGEASADHPQFYNEFHALTVMVGKTHCRRVPRCEGCPLASDLPGGKVET